jgi:hypothetical protein
MPLARWFDNINNGNVVVIIKNVVANTLVSTTTYYTVVKILTTGKYMWSLIVLTMEPLTTMDDHIFMVINNL